MFELSEVQIELTGICNARCDYCDWQKREIGRQHMATALALRLLDECKALGVTTLRYHGLGESLLHPDLLQIIRYGESLRLPHSLSTNCYNLRGELAEEMARIEGLHFILAVPWVMGGRFVDRCIENATAFLASRPANHRVHIQMVTHENAHQYYRRFVDTFLPFAESTPNVFLHLKSPVTWPTDTPNVGFIETELRGNPKVILGELATPVSIGKDCRMPETLLMVLADGEIVPCCISAVSWGIGNAHALTLREAWRGAEMERVRELWRAKSDLLPCGYCLKRVDTLT